MEGEKSMTEKELDEIVERNMKSYIKNVESYVGKTLPKQEKEDIKGLIEVSALYKEKFIEERQQNRNEEVLLVLTEIRKELHATRECLEPLKEICKKLGTNSNIVIPVENGLTQNQMRELYGLKRIEEALADKVLISTNLYDMLLQNVYQKDSDPS